MTDQMQSVSDSTSKWTKAHHLCLQVSVTNQSLAEALSSLEEGHPALEKMGDVCNQWGELAASLEIIERQVDTVDKAQADSMWRSCANHAMAISTNVLELAELLSDNEATTKFVFDLGQGVEEFYQELETVSDGAFTLDKAN